MGANIGVWNERYFKQLRKPGSKLNGIAVMPEASCNNPVAFAFMAELPWRTEPVDLDQWFAGWAAHRYGRRDAQAARSWQILGATAYRMESGQWSEAHDNLFSARPALDAKSACTWGPQEARYDLGAFALALGPLLKADESLAKTSAYNYDLVDVARQTIANHSRVLLPRIEAAYRSADLALFRGLTAQWLKEMDLLDRLAALEPSLWLSRWIEASQAMAANDEERSRFEFDASSLLLEWGPESSRNSGVHDYANREWNGLLAHYRDRWSTYIAMLDASLESHEPAHEIDWFALDQDWALKRKQFPARSRTDVRSSVQAIYDEWRS
jgi:alpha-N-acetylglucosaminidase